MRIIMFINSYIEGLSGGDTWAIEIAKRLDLKKNVKVDIVTPQRAANIWKEKGLNQSKFIITTKEEKPHFLPFLYFKRILNYLKKNLNSDNNDILFATSIFFPDVLPLLFLKGKKVAIFHMQAPHPFFGYKNILDSDQKNLNFGNLINWLNEKICMYLLRIKKTNMLVLPSTKNIVRSYGFHEGSIFITKNGVDLPYIQNIPQGEKEFDACWVGRPHPQKGVDDLLDIWKKVSEKKPNARLVLIGANTENYQDIIIKKGLDKHIKIKGYVSDEEKFNIMKKSRLFLSTSYFESFHIALMEAIACGLDIIAYDLPVYHQIYGNLIDYVKLGNKEEYAKRIESFSYHGGKQADGSIQRDDFIDKFDWNNIAEQVYSIIENIK